MLKDSVTCCSLPDHRRILLPAVIAFGVVSQIAQIVLLRDLLMVFHGNELSIGLILAAWMVWGGVGSRLGALIGEHRRNPRGPLLITMLAVVVVLPLTLYAVRTLRRWLVVLPGAHPPIDTMALACLIVLAPIGLLLGAHFVLLARTWRRDDDFVPTAGGDRTYIAEAAGNALGGAGFSLALVHVLDAFQIVVLAGLLLLATTAWAIGTGHRRWLVPTVLGAVLILLYWGRLEDRSWRHHWRQFAPEHQLVAVRQSKHGTIAVTEREGQYSFYQSGNLLFSMAGPAADPHSAEEHEAAVLAHLALLQHRRPQNVLLIGGGLRGTLREMLHHPIARIDAIELDPALTAAARPYLNPNTRAALDDPRLHFIHGDGRLFVKTTDRRYDLVIVDGPDPATVVLNRYYTEEFFAEVDAVLESDGVLVIGATSSPGLRGRAVANRNATIYHTLRRVFATALPIGDRSLLFFASQDPEQISADPAVLGDRWLERDIATNAFSHRHLPVLLDETPLRRMNHVIRHHGRRPGDHREAPDTGPLFPPSIAEQERSESALPSVDQRFFINTDLRPIGAFHTLILWDSRSGGDNQGLLAALLDLRLGWLLAPLILVLALTLGLRLIASYRGRPGPTRLAVVVAVATTGFSTMAVQIALLFAFQSQYGFVYEMVGMIVALFMAGLALGAKLGHRFLRGGHDPRWILIRIQALIALGAGGIALVLPLMATMPPTMAFLIYCVMTIGAGLLGGLGFPQANACRATTDGRPLTATGIIYGSELFGGALGAVVAGVLLAPVMGIVFCCVLASIANASACLTLIIAGRTNDSRLPT